MTAMRAPESLDIYLRWLAHHAFLNVYIAPVLWFSLSLALLPLSPLIVWLLCVGIGSISLVRMWLRPSDTARAVKDWSREVVVVTGGSHGVGDHIATTLARTLEAKAVIVLDINPPLIQNANVFYFKCDVSNKTAVREVAAKIIRTHGHPTMLVNNAGIVRGKTLLDLTEEDIERTVGVNLLAQFFLVKAFLPGFIDANRGHIVNIASVMGMVGVNKMTDYCASKFGAVGFTEALRQELVGTNVAVSCIYPGLIETGMFHGVQQNLPWVTPPLSIETVANTVIAALKSGQDQEIKLPLYGTLLPILRVLPSEISDLVKYVTGANNGMNTFSGSHAKTAH
ncbi:hypothetical protein BC831DRAFT_453779 [Entophlyctis helioformis]|nr:hypothetical protein BC831DRAFT_453779 [Entophlyctis helioformis]